MVSPAPTPDSPSGLRLSPHADPVPPAPPSPLALGASRFARSLQADLARLRDFRSVAILEGRHGSGRFELALTATPRADLHKFVCHADEFTPARLATLLAPAHAGLLPVRLVVLEAGRLSLENQSLLEALIRAQLPPHAALAPRLRLVLCAQTSLSDLHFNEFLLIRAATSTFRIPDFTDRWQDWADICRAILRRAHPGGLSFGADALKWVDRELWPGDYMQLHRTIELAARLAAGTLALTDAHLAAARAQEPACNTPLYHDHLYHNHSGD